MRNTLCRLISASPLILFPLLAAAQNAAQSPAQPPAQESQPPKPQITPEMRGDIYMARRMFREAIEAYQSVQPPTAVILNKIGIAYQQMGDLESAKKMYERALKLNKKYPEAINNLGTIHYARKSYRRAISAYRKALQLNPDSASIYSNLGTAYFARKDYKRAIECYEKAISLDPDVFERRGTHGVLLQERSVEERAKFHYHLAKVYAKNGRNDLALFYIRKSLEEGFREKRRYLEESEFAEIRKLPEFEEIMKIEPRIL
ncbi:MAG: tetratricopeptide repeat protein [Bryobacteraceae bacterium]|nr:tetratricopeptide repeat protein [Bryobacteraceae bacterium]